MASKIHVLPSALIDQIAAGEVVERPASVVKELLDNAVDAGATRVTVELEEGGLRLIRVTDNGHGMTREDAALALERHATSKIQSLRDLETLRTLGFRGEALPSMASVSRFSLTTRPSDALGGTRVSVDGGGTRTVSEVGCAQGTIVEVADLFFNIPARRKFLKGAAHEAGRVGNVCFDVALALPQLHLRLLREGKPWQEYLPVADVNERAASAFRSTLHHMHGARERISVRALLGPPENARTGTAGLHLFVNGRPVRDRMLARSVAFAYGSVLPPGRYPMGAVFVDAPPGEVDVNVHPQKTEVRFAQSQLVFEAVTQILAAALGRESWTTPASAPIDEPSRHREVRPSLNTASGAPDPWDALARALGDRSSPAHAETRASPSSSQPSLGARETIATYASARPSPQEISPTTSPPLRSALSSLRVLAQARKTFLICEGREGLVFLDQHAADERVRYHRLRKAYGSRSVEMQRLLLPVQLECSTSDLAWAEDNEASLSALGLECRIVGETTLCVHGVPALLSRAQPEQLLRDAIDQLAHLGERSFGDAVDTALATMACHGAIRAGDALSLMECEALLRSLGEVPEFAGHCPHGRPIVHALSFAELERRVGR